MQLEYAANRRIAQTAPAGIFTGMLLGCNKHRPGSLAFLPVHTSLVFVGAIFGVSGRYH